VFERLNNNNSEEEGGTTTTSTNTVYYLPDDKQLLHKGKHYTVHDKIPEDAEVVDLFQHGDNSLILKLKHPNVGTAVKQCKCPFVAMPDVEQKARLTKLFQLHGEKVAKVAERMKADFGEMNALFSGLETDINEICPGFELCNSQSSELHEHSYPLFCEEEFENMGVYLENMHEEAVALAKVTQPVLFSDDKKKTKKRKAAASDDDE
jgi:hypothetical protein